MTSSAVRFCDYAVSLLRAGRKEEAVKNLLAAWTWAETDAEYVYVAMWASFLGLDAYLAPKAAN